MKYSIIAGALCSGASGIGMIMASGTFAGAMVGLGAMYCCVVVLFTMIADGTIQGLDDAN